MIDVLEQKVSGWRAIAHAIGKSDRAARTYAVRKRDPLPVYWYLGDVVAHATALRDWVQRQVVPLQLRDRQQSGVEFGEPVEDILEATGTSE